MASTETGAGGDRIVSSVSAPANVLLLAPAMSDAADVCPTVGLGTGRPESLLLVLLHGSLERRLEVWRRHGGLPESVSVVSCEVSRSSSAAMPSSSSMLSPAGGGGIQVASISSPGNLPTIGRAIERWLTTDASGPVHVCFDSLTTLLQYVDPRPTYQYLHGLLPRLTDNGAVGHFHMDVGAHDELTRRRIQSLFDVTFRYDEAADEWVRC